MWPAFDLQLFGGGGPNPQESSADQYYQQLANQSNQQFQQWQQFYMPMLQQYGPMLMDTLNGKPNALLSAAEAPVNAATSRAMNTMQNNVGGLTNPDAAYADIALGGQQQAGLSADNLLSNSMQSLQGLLGMGQQGVGMGMTGMGNAGSGEANLGGQIWNQQNAWINSLMSGIGEGAGMYATGGMGGGAKGASAGMSPIAMGSLNQGGPASNPMSNPYTFFSQSMAPPGTSMDSSGASSPISGGTGSWTGVGPQP